MEISEKEIVAFIEPVFRFCVKRLGNRSDAEDLVSEIMVHVLSGIGKYRVEALDRWVWRIARNRYARFIDARNRRDGILTDNDCLDVQDDYYFVDAMIVAQEYQEVFRYLHTLSSTYRDILVDYYIGGLSVRRIAGR